MTEFQKNIRDAVAPGDADAKRDAASKVIEQIKDSHKARRVIDWPGKPGVKVEMRLLNLSEARKAKVENQLEFKKDDIEIGMHNLADYREQEAVHGMWRVFTDPTTGKRIFNSAEDMRSFCTTDELTALCAAYNTFADENDPNLSKLDESEMQDLVEVLKKTPDLIPQKVPSLNLAWKLLRILVVRQAN